MASEHLFEEIQACLELIDSCNDQIDLHLSWENPDSLAIEGFRKRKDKLTGQLIELLSSLDLHLQPIEQAA